MLLCCLATTGKRFPSRSLSLPLFLSILPNKASVKLVVFVSFIDMIGFRREIRILLWSWEVKERVTTKIIFAHVCSRIVLQKEDVIILVVIFEHLRIKGFKAIPYHSRKTFNMLYKFTFSNY